MQRIGLEYELEGLGDWGDILPPRGWKVTADGTLRGNGAEYLTRGPIDIAKAGEYLKRLLKHLDGNYTVSHRCSMHMHIDFNGLVRWQRIGGLCLLIAYEKEFFKFSPDRIDNHFCTRQLRSPAFYQSLYLMSQQGYEWEDGRVIDRKTTLTMPRYRSVNTKYTAVNASPMRDGGLGTVELRHFAPIMEVKELEQLTKIVKQVMQSTRAMPDHHWTDARKHMHDYGQRLPKKLAHVADAIDWTIDVVDSLNKRKDKPAGKGKIQHDMVRELLGQVQAEPVRGWVDGIILDDREDD